MKNSLQKGDDLTAGGSLMLNRRLGTAGRNITFRGSYNYTNSESEQFSASTTDYFQLMQDSTEILNRYITTPTKSYNYSLRFSYSEPIFRGGSFSSATTSSISIPIQIILRMICRWNGRLIRDSSLPGEA